MSHWLTFIIAPVARRRNPRMKKGQRSGGRRRYTLALQALAAGPNAADVEKPPMQAVPTRPAPRLNAAPLFIGRSLNQRTACHDLRGPICEVCGSFLLIKRGWHHQHATAEGSPSECRRASSADEGMRRRVLQHDLDMYAAVSGRAPAVPPPALTTGPIAEVAAPTRIRTWSPLVLAACLRQLSVPRIAIRVLPQEKADWLRRMSTQAVERLTDAQGRLASSRPAESKSPDDAGASR